MSSFAKAVARFPPVLKNETNDPLLIVCDFPVGVTGGELPEAFFSIVPDPEDDATELCLLPPKILLTKEPLLLLVEKGLLSE